MASDIDNHTVNDANDTVQKIVAACLFSTTSFLGIIGNILVISAVALSRQLQTLTNVFVVVLAVTDLLNCLILPVQVLSLVGKSDWVLFLWACTIVGVCLYIFIGISVATLALIAMNRCYTITKSREDYRKLYTRKNIVIMVVAVDVAIGLVTIVFAATGLATFGSYEGVCAHATGNSYTYLSGVWLLLSLALIVYCYTRIYTHVKRHLRRVASLDKSEAETNQQRCPKSDEPNEVRPGFAQRQREIESKITTNMLIIIVLFFLCVFPSIFTLILPGDQQASAIIISIISINSCLNPMVYAWKHPIFRQVFKCILGGQISRIAEPTQWARSLQRTA